MGNVQSENLVNLWMQHSIGAKEDFDLMIVEFLETLNEDVSIYDVLNDARNKASKKLTEFSDDIALQLSHRAFDNSLEYQLGFWRSMAENH